jgi:hypothetical protein
MIVSALAGIAPAAAGMPGGDDPSSPTIGTTVAAPGQVRVANKFSAPFVTMAGSQENAVALANALRTGSPATLTYASLATDPADPTTTITTVTITPPTKPMGWGNVSHSLGLAQVALNQAGIGNPTGAQLQAALQGGSVTTADGTTVAFAGVLQQRANGAGWGSHCAELRYDDGGRESRDQSADDQRGLHEHVPANGCAHTPAFRRSSQRTRQEPR